MAKPVEKPESKAKYKVYLVGNTVRIYDKDTIRTYLFSDPYTATIFARMIK